MENVKRNLRSVLLSKAGGVPLKNVERDYKNLVGDRLNWRLYGFGSFEAFLNEIPDVAKVAFKKDEMYAFGVAENMSYINPTARKAQFRDVQPRQNGTCNNTGKMTGSTEMMTVYFGNLPADMTQVTLKSFLNEYPVIDIQTAKIVNTIAAWVTTSEESGELMISEFNGKRYNNQRLKVEPARGRTSFVKKQNVPARPSACDSSGQSSSTSGNSDVDSSSLRTQFSKNNAAVESQTTWSKRNGVEERQLHHEVVAEPCQQQWSPVPPVASNNNPVVAWEATANDYARPSGFLLGSKDSANVSGFQFKSGAKYGQQNKDFLSNSFGEPPPLIEGEDWEEEFKNGTSLECVNNQKCYSNETRDEPPPLFLIDDFKKPQQTNEISSSASSPLNAAPRDKEPGLNPFNGDFNLYVRNIPVGTTLDDMSQLFENAVKFVKLPRQCCFVVFETFQEVEDAAKRSWTIRGSPIFVDVASRHKFGGKDQVVDLSAGFENLTCTIGSNNERKVQLCGEILPLVNKNSSIRSQPTGKSDSRENFQERSNVQMADMPPLVSSADQRNSPVRMQPAQSDVFPPLLSKEDLDGLHINQPPLSRKAMQLTKLCNSEMTERDRLASTRDDTSHSKQPDSNLNSRGAPQLANRKTESSKQPHDFDGDYETANLNGVRSRQMHIESNSRERFSKSLAKQGNSSEVNDSSEISGQNAMPVLKHHHPDHSENFQPSSDASRTGGLDDYGCTASLNIQLPMATASSQSGVPSLSPLKPIPDEMRLKELQRMRMDTFPGDTLPTSYLLPDVIDVIIICTVPGFESNFFWGQVASGPFASELTKMYELTPRMDELSSSLIPASAALRRGATKYADDWCRVWIKLRGETASTCFFIDFGNFETVSNNNIYELPEDFWKVRPAAMPFRVLDSVKFNISDYINRRVTARVNKKSQRGCIFEIYDLQANS